MARRRILTLFGTRPEAVKLAPVLASLARHSATLESIVCCTGQHDTLVRQATATFGIEADIELDALQPGQSLGQLASRMYAQVDRVVADVRPDRVLVQGDTTSAMVAATCAAYARVAVGHVEAGLRTFDRLQPFPEEMNREIVSRVADLHFAPTARSAENLRREGVPAERVHVTGNTVVDALDAIRPRIEEGADATVKALVSGAPRGSRMILVTTHRREAFGEGIERICDALMEIAAHHAEAFIVVVKHPNPGAQEPVVRRLGGHKGIALIDPVDYVSILYLVARSHFILTDSGGIQEEAPSFGKPVLVLRAVTERPEAVEAGCARIVGTDATAIVAEASCLLGDARHYASMVARANPFGDGHAGERIAAILAAQAPA